LSSSTKTKKNILHLYQQFLFPSFFGSVIHAQLFSVFGFILYLPKASFILSKGADLGAKKLALFFFLSKNSLFLLKIENYI
jgi:hypothetical protein